jgi:hypothetical protein
MGLSLCLVVALASPSSEAMVAATAHARVVDAVDAADAGPVRQTVARYARAIRTRDVALFRTVMPTLDRDSELRLRRAFETAPVERLDITIESVEIDGTTATVRASRRDVIAGRQMKPVEQEFHLSLQRDAWCIRSLSARD